MAANSFYSDEVQEYLNYIRTIGMEAWIPDSPGYGPKMSVPDQCRCGVLCLNYKGSEIYVRSNSQRALNLAVVPGSTYSSENRRRSVRQNPVGNAVVDYGYESINRFYVDDRGENYNIIIDRVPSKRSVGVQCGDGLIRCNGNILLTSHRDECRTSTAGYDGNPVNTDSRTYSFSNMGAQYKRIVNDKLTKEVRVAKSYVSTLPISTENRRDHHHRSLDHRHHQYRVNNMLPSDHTDFKNRQIQSEIVRLNSKGIVRKFIDRIDVFYRNQDKN